MFTAYYISYLWCLATMVDLGHTLLQQHHLHQTQMTLFGSITFLVEGHLL